MAEVWQEKHDNYLAMCHEALKKVQQEYFIDGSIVSEAAAYSLMNGGKRVRGVFVLAVADMLGGLTPAAADLAAALEMVHAFSLIHDDLPCMDDDDMRRGKPACHKAYGEATALLAGDLLALEAFEVISHAALGAEARIEAVRVLAAAAGARGMILGQELDLDSEDKQIDEARLHAVHSAKTGALFLASAQLGILAAGGKLEKNAAAEDWARKIGLVFQVVDDILDVTSTTEVLGKPVGSDDVQGKSTFITLRGLEGSQRYAEDLTRQAMAALETAYGERAGFLNQYANRLLGRSV